MLLFCCFRLPFISFAFPLLSRNAQSEGKQQQQQQWHYRRKWTLPLYLSLSLFFSLARDGNLPLHLAYYRSRIVNNSKRERRKKNFLTWGAIEIGWKFLSTRPPIVNRAPWYGRWVSMPSVKEKLLIIIALFFSFVLLLFCAFIDTLSRLVSRRLSLQQKIYRNLL
jgi:hypothetical protein